MPIVFHEEDKILHLQSKRVSYCIKIYPGGLVGNVYWGRRLEEPQDLASLVCLRDKRNPPQADKVDYEGMEDLLYAEYPAYGTSDFRQPAFQVRQADGSLISNLRYASHRIEAGKPSLPCLPYLWCSKPEEANTLVIVLEDSLTGLKADLFYTLFAETGALVRSVRFVNNGAAAVDLVRALSFGVDLEAADYDFVHLDGSWARERQIVREPILGGAHSVESTRGFSSHQHSPFIAVCEPAANEEAGAVYGFNLVYSGNFLAQAARDQFGSTRVLMGINPFGFSWRLEAGETFRTPECAAVFSNRGFGAMSRAFHKLYRENLIRHQNKPRPILVNNWEATYFNFTEEKLLEIAETAADLGIELFVLDDGWFGRRDSDNSSLGDWVEDRRKLPSGLKALAEKINAGIVGGIFADGVLADGATGCHAGNSVQTRLKFGLWFEPEMISPDSALYQAHPDWCIHVENRRRTEIRSQLVLDLTRAEVRAAVIEMVSKILREVPIAYVKWDMNRPLTELGSASLPPDRQQETGHRYMLGVYEMMEKITAAFPDVLFEGCAGGGSRFDPGILFYMPQIWTSDDSDAFERCRIQYATSLFCPLSAMGAHVSAVPNHQTGRITPLETRANVALFGTFGYELDLTKFTADEKEAVKKQVGFYKKHRALIQTGDFFRLKSPFDSGRHGSGGNGSTETAWIVVSADKTQALALYVRSLAAPNPPLATLKLAGLDPDAVYAIGVKAGYTATGGLLMSAGIRLPAFWGDFQSCVWELSTV